MIIPAARGDKSKVEICHLTCNRTYVAIEVDENSVDVYSAACYLQTKEERLCLSDI